MYPVKFYPIPVLRVWGGHELKTTFNGKCEAELPADPVGEYWVLSGHPNGTSVVSNGHLKGRTLVELTEQFPDEFLGMSAQPRFPLLIKFLEASDDLSVQVHPTDDYSQKYENDFGKTEAWYVLDSREDGRVVYGHRFADRYQLFDSARQGTIAAYLEYQSIQAGDTVFVPAKTLHALLAGTKVIEVQQTSDVTYRVYDWDRPGSDGKPRELHLEKSADVLFGLPHGANHDGESWRELPADHVKRYDGRTPNLTWVNGDEGGEVTELVSCDYFSMFKVVLREGQTMRFGRHDSTSPDVLIGAEGSGRLHYVPSCGDQSGVAVSMDSLTIDFGETVLIPTSVNEVELESTDGQSATFLIVRYGN